MELSAALISRVLGQQATTQEGRLRALLLISSLAAFDAGSHVAAPVLAWPGLDSDIAHPCWGGSVTELSVAGNYQGRAAIKYPTPFDLTDQRSISLTLEHYLLWRM